MTLVSFEAGICTLDENIEDEYHMVAFADKESYPENYVLLQRAFEFDEHDLECGLDGFLSIGSAAKSSTCKS